MSSNRSGRTTKSKRLTAVLDHWRLEILRNGLDRPSLEKVRQRALRDKDVRNDPNLTREIEEFVRDRAANIAANHQDDLENSAFINRSRSNFSRYNPSDADVATTIDYVKAQARNALAHHNEVEAGFALERLKSIRESHPLVISEESIIEIESAIEGIKKWRSNARDRVEQLVTKAEEAASLGKNRATGRMLKKLSSYHVVHPDIINDEEMEAIRQRIIRAGEKHYHHESAKLLIQREKAVNAELANLRKAIQEFRITARRYSHDHADYKKAEAKYVAAVNEIRHHDIEWLSGTILELVDLLEEWEDHPSSADKQLEAFIRSLKDALKILHAEVRSVEIERRSGS